MDAKRIVVIAASLCALSGCYSAPYSPDTGYMQAPRATTTTTTTERTTTTQPAFLDPAGTTTTTTTVRQTAP